MKINFNDTIRSLALSLEALHAGMKQQVVKWSPGNRVAVIQSERHFGAHSLELRPARHCAAHVPHVGHAFPVVL